MVPQIQNVILLIKVVLLVFYNSQQMVCLAEGYTNSLPSFRYGRLIMFH